MEAQNITKCRGIEYLDVLGTLTKDQWYSYLHVNGVKVSGLLTEKKWPAYRQIAQIGEGLFRIRIDRAVDVGVIPVPDKTDIMYSATATQHGYGTAKYKWVSGATEEERAHARRGGVVLFDDGVPCGGNYGTTLRMMVWKDGRFVPRVPSSEIIAKWGAN
jgi:hypothetical protein